MYKLSITEDEQDIFNIILINTVLEDYKLAFHLNKIMPFQFSKSLKPAFIKNKNKYDFEFYKYENEVDNVFWYLIPNKKTILKELKTLSLFDENIQKTIYFLKEFNKFDYIIKLTDDNIIVIDFLKKINQINNISSAIIVEREKTKHIKHLNF
jgi:hypothetical protein